jgi:hypothetical protein
MEHCCSNRSKLPFLYFVVFMQIDELCGETDSTYRILVEKFQGNESLGYLRLDEGTILKRISGK